MSRKDGKWLAFFAGGLGFEAPMLLANVAAIIKDGGWWSGFCLAVNMLALILCAVFVWHYVNKAPRT